MAIFVSKTTNAGQEVTDLTACRALFAAWVFIYHVDLQTQFSAHLGFLGSAIRQGYLGVDGFFVLSGLILARVHGEFEKSTATYWHFWLKRLARIYPVHLAIIVLLGIIIGVGAAMGVAPRDPTRFGLIGLAENLLLVQGWGFGNPWTWNYPAWTVSTEMAGYLLFPFLSRATHRIGMLITGQIALICVPVLGILSVLSGHGLNVALYFPLIRFFAEFIIGIQLARMVPLAADTLPNLRIAGVGLFFVLLGLYFHLDLITVLGLVIVLFGLTSQADAERPTLFGRLPWLRALGILSYAFYMSFATSELLLAQVFRREHLDLGSHKLLYAAAMTGLTFAIAIILHVLVENPCRRFADRRLPLNVKPAKSGGLGNNPVPGSRRSLAK